MEEINNISGNNPFRVPENYLEEVNSKIIAATCGNDSMIKKQGIIRKIRPYLAVAASVALLTALGFASSYFFSARNNPELPEISVNEFSDNYLDEINLLTLEENSGYSDNNVSMTLSDNDIYEYFAFENVDINEIYTQF